MKHVVVYGPAACGKTRNSAALAKAYGCEKIVEEFLDGIERPAKTLFLLTSSGPPKIPAAVDRRFVEIVPFAEAMRVAGLQP